MVVYSALYQVRVRSWPSTHGVLLDAGLGNFGPTHRDPARRDFVLKARYEYCVDGKSYRGHRVSPWVVVASTNLRMVLARQSHDVNRQADGSVEVFFNPRRPGRSFLVRPGRVGLFVTLAVGVLPMLLYYVKYHA